MLSATNCPACQSVIENMRWSVGLWQVKKKRGGGNVLFSVTLRQAGGYNLSVQRRPKSGKKKVKENINKLQLAQTTNINNQTIKKKCKNIDK